MCVCACIHACVCVGLFQPGRTVPCYFILWGALYHFLAVAKRWVFFGGLGRERLKKDPFVMGSPSSKMRDQKLGSNTNCMKYLSALYAKMKIQ